MPVDGDYIPPGIGYRCVICRRDGGHVVGVRAGVGGLYSGVICEPCFVGVVKYDNGVAAWSRGEWFWPLVLNVVALVVAVGFFGWLIVTLPGVLAP